MGLCSNVPSQNWEKHRYLNKGANENERNLVSSIWDELIGRYGSSVEYYTYNYQLSAHDSIYGEQPTADFSDPINLIGMVEIASEAILLSKFGIQTDADATIVISTREYLRVFGDVEPKSGDVIRLTELGWSSDELPPTDSAALTGDIKHLLCYYKDIDDPATLVYPSTADRWGRDVEYIRCPQLYEITERPTDQVLNYGANTLMGHHIWVLKLKRFDYSYQPGIEPECHMGDVGEETRTGLLSGGRQDQSADKDYPQNVDTISDDEIWDYNTGKESRDDEVYGDY